MKSNPEILKASNPRISRILLVRLRQIGDVVFTTPAIHAVRQRFPDAHITYIVEPAAAPVVARNPHIDELIVAPKPRGVAGVAAEAALVRRLRAKSYDLAIDFHGGPRASLLTWLSGARRRVGYTVAGRSWMYTDRVRRTRELQPRHSVENQWDLLAALGIDAAAAAAFAVEMPVDPAAAAEVARRLARAGVRPADQLIVVHVSSNSPFRRWPAASFATAIAALARGGDTRRIVVTAGPSETDAVDRIVAEVRGRGSEIEGDRIVRCGEFSLSELRALMDIAAVYIGGDSGPLHVAGTSSVPIVALYGPTLPARSRPWRSASAPSVAVDAGPLPCRPCDQRVCAPGDFRCLTSIEPDAVIGAAERLLAGVRPSPARPRETRDTAGAAEAPR